MSFAESMEKMEALGAHVAERLAEANAALAPLQRQQNIVQATAAVAEAAENLRMAKARLDRSNTEQREAQHEWSRRLDMLDVARLNLLDILEGEVKDKIVITPDVLRLIMPTK